MSTISSFLPFVYPVLAVLGIAAAYFAFRQQYAQALSQIQAQVISALKDENAQQARQIAQLEATVSTIRVALRQRGIQIAINGEYVTFTDVGMPKHSTVKIKKDDVTAQATQDDTPPDVQP